MSEDSRERLKQMFEDLGTPPPPTATLGNLTMPASQRREKSDRTEQLNLRVPPDLKRRVRVLATRDDISLSEVIIRAVALYEREHGAAPEL